MALLFAGVNLMADILSVMISLQPERILGPRVS